MAISRVQFAMGTTGAVTAATMTVTLPAVPTAGNLLIAALGGLTATPPTIASDAAITWIPVIKPQSSTTAGVCIGLVRSTPASSVLTVTNVGGNSSYGAIIAEYSGITFPRVDVTIGGTGTTGATIATGNSVRTTTTAAELWVTALAQRTQNSTTSQTAPPLIVGHTYLITTWNTPDNFTNCGGANVTGNCFTATNTTPTSWGALSVLLDVTFSQYTAPTPSGTVIVGQISTFVNTANNDRSMALLEFITSGTGNLNGGVTASVTTQQWIAMAAAIDSNPAQAGGATAVTFAG